MTTGPITAYHGTIYTIDAWRLPAPGERNSRGPASICFSPDPDVAKGYCNAADGGTEEIARLIARVNDAYSDLVLDHGCAEKPHFALYRQLKGDLEALEEAWRAGKTTCTERVYRTTIAPRNPLRISAAGRNFYNLTGVSGGDQDMDAFARRALEQGHDCLIVEDVIDNGHAYLRQRSTTIVVLDPAILGAPALVHEERLTYAEVLARADRRKAAMELT